ncbi:MAG TPA: putative colanic acid biosynthesis acetyltransferase [Chromatiaceae bacterium]|jgi:putative colanic acid biosynthesis acetyltransferase WcaF|nr:MAG: putative colanic acid biosynthesis acetyltransferase [Thiohalocapsa sp. PB-PSB1]HBG95817.1 putative colanic acid biosynthesis acetyltransferase [Chromatiaceae bacterium]HCS88712.1 putative colanic acid biosynthesis acetyltransferase [Chromatiaceae bacterium]
MLKSRAQPGLRSKIVRGVWNIVWLLFYRPTPTMMHGWRRFLLRLFGAKIGRPVYPYPSARVWAPWNLEMGDHSTLAQGVDCYCVDRVRIGSLTTVSQYSYLCTATHDYTDSCILTQPQMPLLTAPITLGDRVWITAGVFIGPGVTIGDGTVVLARSSVFKDLPPWVVAAGSPATARKERCLRSDSPS